MHDLAAFWAEHLEEVRTSVSTLSTVACIRDPLALTPPELDHGHSHPIPTLVMPIAGPCRVSWCRGDCDLAVGSALLIGPCTQHHHVLPRHDDTCFHLGFKDQFCDIAISSGGRRREALVDQQNIRPLLDQALLADSDSERTALVAQAISHSLDATLTFAPEAHEAVDRMMLFLWRHYLQPISTADVLAHSGLGSSRAHELFQAQIGHGPGAECRRLRMEAARYLLRGGLSVTAVSQRCAYPNRRSFTRAFKQQTGLSPQQWCSKHVSNNH